MNTLRERLASIDPARDTRAYSEPAAAAVVHRIIERDAWSAEATPVTGPAATSRSRRSRRLPVAAVAALVTLTLGGVAVAELRPVDEVASRPLAAPLIVSGVGPADVALPPAPDGATHLHVELTCFTGTLCSTPAGSVEGPESDEPKVDRGAFPLGAGRDPADQQSLTRLDPGSGLPVIVHAGTHWRLYAVYSDGFDPREGRLADGRVFGIPDVEIPDFVPVVATNGKTGWVSYLDLTHDARPILTGSGVRQDPLPVYSGDGETVIGSVDVSATLQP